MSDLVSCKMKDKKTIDDLHDVLLQEILARLTLKDAVRTCILAQRWKSLWDRGDSVMEFNGMIILQKNDFELREMYKTNRRAFEKGKKAFISDVDAFMNSRTDKVRKSSFKLNFFFKHPATQASFLDKCIARSLEMEIQELTLELWSGWPWYKVYCSDPNALGEDQFYDFMSDLLPERLTANLRSLNLEICMFKPSVKTTSYFCNLRELKLCMVITDNAYMKKIMYNCPLLLKLQLINCWDLRGIAIVGENSLVHLSILNFSYKLKIKIDSPKLECFEYMGSLEDVSLIYAPNLKTVFFCSDSKEEVMLPKQFNYINLLTLYSTNACGVDMTVDFKHLRSLVFVMKNNDSFQDFSWVSEIMRALYLLENLTFSMRKPTKNKMVTAQYSVFPENQLQNLQMVGFSGSQHELKLLKCFLQTSPRLKRLGITTYVRYNWGAERWLDQPTEPSWFSDRKKETESFLKNELPSSVNLELLEFL